MKINPVADRRSLWLLGCMALAAIAVVAACGKKGPPRPPQIEAEGMRIVLTVASDQKHAILRWQCDPCDPAVRSYAVYQSRTDAAAPDCPGCPIVFEKVEQVAAVQPSRALSLSLDTARGSHYRFKVVAQFKSGAPGVSSNVVEIDTAP